MILSRFRARSTSTRVSPAPAPTTPHPAGCPFGHGTAASEPARATTPRAEPFTEPFTDPAQAAAFLRQFHAEHPGATDPEPRVRQVLDEIERTGTYRHTPQELSFGARLAWRNSARCIGRLYWRSLVVRDLRSAAAPTTSPRTASSTCAWRATAAGSAR